MPRASRISAATAAEDLDLAGLLGGVESKDVEGTGESRVAPLDLRPLLGGRLAEQQQVGPALEAGFERHRHVVVGLHRLARVQEKDQLAEAPDHARLLGFARQVQAALAPVVEKAAAGHDAAGVQEPHRAFQTGRGCLLLLPVVLDLGRLDRAARPQPVQCVGELVAQAALAVPPLADEDDRTSPLGERMGVGRGQAELSDQLLDLRIASVRAAELAFTRALGQRFPPASEGRGGRTTLAFLLSRGLGLALRQ